MAFRYFVMEQELKYCSDSVAPLNSLHTRRVGLVGVYGFRGYHTLANAEKDA